MIPSMRRLRSDSTCSSSVFFRASSIGRCRDPRLDIPPIQQRSLGSITRRLRMALTSRRSTLSYIVFAVAGFRVLPARAVDAADAEVHRLQSTWEAIKFGVPEGDEQTKQMNALGDDADAVAARFSDRPEVLIWDGIITSERASLASAF